MNPVLLWHQEKSIKTVVVLYKKNIASTIIAKNKKLNSI